MGEFLGSREAESERWGVKRYEIEQTFEKDIIHYDESGGHCNAEEVLAEIAALKSRIAELEFSQCSGIPRRGCDYLSQVNHVCIKCGEVHTTHELLRTKDALVGAEQRIAELERMVPRWITIEDWHRGDSGFLIRHQGKMVLVTSELQPLPTEEDKT